MQTEPVKTVTTYSAVVGNVLAQERDKKRLNQGEVAKAAGVTQATLSRMENGQSAITVEHLKQLGDKLGMPASQILLAADNHAFNIQMNGVEIVKTPPETDIHPVVFVLAGAALAAFMYACVKAAKA